MERSKKSEYVANLKEKFESSAIVVAVTQNRLTVAEVEVLRKKLNAEGGRYCVVKDTLARIALKGTQYEELIDVLKGQIGIVFSNSTVETARAVMDFADKSEGKVVVVAGGVEGKKVDAKYIDMLSKLPTLDEARAKIIAVIQTPGGQVARVLKAYSEK